MKTRVSLKYFVSYCRLFFRGYGGLRETCSEEENRHIDNPRRDELTKGVNTMKKVRKCVEVIRELDNTENIQIGFSSIIQRSDKDFSNEIKDTNIKLKNYCLGKGFIFVDNDNINESCLNNSKLHLNKKGTQRFAKNIFSSLDNI